MTLAWQSLGYEIREGLQNEDNTESEWPPKRLLRQLGVMDDERAVSSE